MFQNPTQGATLLCLVSFRFLDVWFLKPSLSLMTLSVLKRTAQVFYRLLSTVIFLMFLSWLDWSYGFGEEIPKAKGRALIHHVTAHTQHDYDSGLYLTEAVSAVFPLQSCLAMLPLSIMEKMQDVLCATHTWGVGVMFHLLKNRVADKFLCLRRVCFCSWLVYLVSHSFRKDFMDIYFIL